MSARRKSGTYPNLLDKDVLSGGSMYLWRNPANQPFAERDVWTLSVNWDTLDDLSDAYTQLENQEKDLAEKHTFAWDTDFGYLSPEPLHCGTGLHVQGEFHLEALNLIGDLPPVINGIEAVHFGCSGIIEDGIRDAAHIYRVYSLATLGVTERDLIQRAHRLFSALVTQETNARLALVEDTPRILEDSIARALAILRSARLLAPGELLDLLSPICLGTTLGFLSGITREETVKMMRSQFNAPDLPTGTAEADRKRDARDAALADRINHRFRSVDFNAYADECLRR